MKLKYLFVITLCCSLLTGILRGEETSPFRVLFSNDTTNIVSCPSPFNPDAAGFQENYLRSEVEEAAGADVQLLQPGLGWVPWWQSSLLPMEKHVRWLATQNQKPNSFDRYVLEGGDLVRVFVEECRKKQITPFISLRVNDMHHVYRGYGETDPTKRLKAMSEFAYFADHPDYLLGPGADRDRRSQYAMDFAHQEVVEYKLKMLEEIAARYDIGGLELDFMRHWYFFHAERTDSEKRLSIMLGFIRKTREILDRTSKPGNRRQLCVRIPAYPGVYDKIGLDLKKWAEAGVDLFNLSGHYFTDMQIDLPLFQQTLPPGTKFYPEIHFVIANRPAVSGKAVVNRRTTEQQITTAAYLAHRRGAAGVSFFNFHYYRGTKNPNDVAGEKREPPFNVIGKLKDLNWLEQQPQHYVVARTFHPDIQRSFDVPCKPNTVTELEIDMTPPRGGWKKEGRLRIQANEPLRAGDWELVLNGTILTPSEDIFEPFGLEDTTASCEETLAWHVPPQLLQDGKNRVALSMKSSMKSGMKSGMESGIKPVHVFFLDLIVP